MESEVLNSVGLSSSSAWLGETRFIPQTGPTLHLISCLLGSRRSCLKQVSPGQNLLRAVGSLEALSLEHQGRSLQGQLNQHISSGKSSDAKILSAWCIITPINYSKQASLMRLTMANLMV
ncbi:hypothetical protein ILYODFUR_035433 [Ilyodon furcidens]|uniref:Uncharacterized protein n=1 Tax=Ilyodon furcidens TaxID=33524 RepID=A0ABV0VJS0_9TELE